MCQDDLEKLYTSDQLPSVSALACPLTSEGASGPKLLKTRMWCWSGAIWKLHKAWLTEKGLVVKRIGFFPLRSMVSWCEGRTARQNNYIAFSMNMDDKLLVVWFDEVSLSSAFVSAFRGLWDAQKPKG
jgi:hypothetical protein